MSSKLFVGGLSWGTRDEALRAAFGPFGEVTDARVVTDRETGRSRGFGFVTYDSPQEAEAARAGMDGAELDGRTLRVDLAQDKAGDGGGGGGRSGGGGYGGGGGGGRSGGGGYGGGGGGGGGYGGGGGGSRGGGGGGGGSRGGGERGGW
jgi:RNA recognition motif-containing protein